MADFIGIHIEPHNDIQLDASNNLDMAYDSEAIGQHVRQRLKFWQGEWFLDETVGVDWLRYALGLQMAEFVRQIAEAEIKRVILDTPGVSDILEIETGFDRAKRTLEVRQCTLLTVFDDRLELQF